ncbi:uncharacterized protein EV420DRAFT_1486471 [Desarmillaria tabescens]|uniref:Telomeric single stranded DNA binding POT1/Cdc13 domain-containing protein n=1 Tax=Armillaria tabescens TaxID=1929756 RepID=A0AA39JAA6_ARMTA|nr:uncharacterized protein EV420DRAFT_1486471 [Desarmillaria tabescens]KAK0439086.1 hypothetical protein EV420DRAFT_1486471 [Desarmillaria tabescens]
MFKKFRGDSSRNQDPQPHFCDGVDVNRVFKDLANRIYTSNLPLQQGFDTTLYIQGRAMHYNYVAPPDNFTYPEVSIVFMMHSFSGVPHAFPIVFSGAVAQGLSQLGSHDLSGVEQMRISLHGASLDTFDDKYTRYTTIPMRLTFNDHFIYQLVRTEWNPKNVGPLISITRDYEAEENIGISDDGPEDIIVRPILRTSWFPENVEEEDVKSEDSFSSIPSIFQGDIDELLDPAKAETSTTSVFTAGLQVKRTAKGGKTSIQVEYTALHQLTSLASKDVNKTKRYNVIGVITSAKGPRPTASKDPSVCGATADTPQTTFTVSCFQKKEDHLINVEIGDVVILRHIKLLFYKRCAGVAYHDKFEYAVYSPAMVKCYPRQVVPQQQYDPQGDELHYVRNMISWWKTIQTVPFKASGKHIPVHEAVVGKYFACTVEVLFIERRDQTLCIWVTDYTQRPDDIVVSSEWCPRVLRKSVIRVELWDEAREQGKMITLGGFYRLGNVLWRKDKLGKAEGKMSEGQIMQLNLNGKDEHLLAMNSRRREKLEQDAQSIDEFHLTHLSDITLDKPFDCIAEYIGGVDIGNEHILYLSDGTKGKYLQDLWNDRPPIHLFKEILPVHLYDHQVHLIKDLQLGSLLVARDLMLHRGYGGKYHVKLKGESENLFVLNHMMRDYKEQKHIIKW